MTPRTPVALLACSPLLLLIAPLRHALESSMLPHMLLEFPLLVLAGAAAATLLREHAAAAARLLLRLDPRGSLGACLLLCCSAVWMVPTALDLALIDPRLAAVKLLSWWGSGLLLGSGGTRMSMTLRVFVIGNLVWMLASAGMLYESAPARLCVSYLQDEQIWTGRALIALALLLLAWLLVQVTRLVPMEEA